MNRRGTLVCTVGNMQAGSFCLKKSYSIVVKMISILPSFLTSICYGSGLVLSVKDTRQRKVICYLLPLLKKVMI